MKKNQIFRQRILCGHQAERLSDQAREVMDYLEQFSVVNQVVIPIKTDDHLVMVKIDDIILAEIDKNVLTIYTVNNTYTMRETLTNFQHRINRRSFYRYHVMLL